MRGYRASKRSFVKLCVQHIIYVCPVTCVYLARKKIIPVYYMRFDGLKCIFFEYGFTYIEK